MEQLSTLILLILLSGLAIALANGGWTGHGGARDWFRAKFLGQVN